MSCDSFCISSEILLKEATDCWFIPAEFDSILILYLIYISILSSFIHIQLHNF